MLITVGVYLVLLEIGGVLLTPSGLQYVEESQMNAKETLAEEVIDTAFSSSRLRRLHRTRTWRNDSIHLDVRDYSGEVLEILGG